MAALWFVRFKFGVSNLPAIWCCESVGADYVPWH